MLLRFFVVAGEGRRDDPAASFRTPARLDSGGTKKPERERFRSGKRVHLPISGDAPAERKAIKKELTVDGRGNKLVKAVDGSMID